MTETTTAPAQFLRRQIGSVRAILLPRRGSGLISTQVYLRRGSCDEGPGEIGLASFTASMLKRGTATRSSSQIAFELESLGAMGGHGAGADATHSTLKCAAADYAAALDPFFDCLRNPVFDVSELEIERQATIAHLMRVEDDSFDFTYRRYLDRIFAGHGYGHTPEGEIEDVKAITAEKCRAWHARAWRPEDMLFTAAGDFDPGELCKLLEPRFAGWPGGGEAAERYDAPVAPPADGASFELAKPDLEQGFIVAGFRTPAFTHPDRPALRLACAALGEGFSGRLFTILRDERSLAYAVGSSLSTHRLGGHMALYIGTQTDRLDEARDGLAEQAERLRHERVTGEELHRAKEYVAGKFIMSHQSLASRAGYLASWEDWGLGPDYDARYVEELKKVTANQVLEAAERWWIEPTVAVLRPDAAKD